MDNWKLVFLGFAVYVAGVVSGIVFPNMFSKYFVLAGLFLMISSAIRAARDRGGQ